MKKRDAVSFLLEKPYKFGHMLGFTKLTKLHNDWIVDMVRGTEDATLQAHRGSYKTTCISIALAIITILLPNYRTLFMRKTDSDVKEVIKQVQKILNDQRTQYFVQCIYGAELTLTTATNNEIMTNLTSDIKGTSQIVGIGIGGSITGKHFDRIFTDDIINVQDRISRAERERTKTVYQELQNVKNKGGRIFNTGTPWHKEDAFSLMPNAKKYDCYQTGLLSKEEIEDIRSKMTMSLFSTNYELKHIAAENTLFMRPDTINAPIETVKNGIAHVDSAFYGEDYTAFSVMTVHDGKYYLYGRAWRKHVEDCYDNIIRLYKDLLCSKLYNELNADKGYVAKDLRKKNIKVVTYNESMNKHIKISTYLKAIWKDIVIVEGTDDIYLDMILDYTEDAEHDDAPDSASCLARLLYKPEKTKDNSDAPRPYLL